MAIQEYLILNENMKRELSSAILHNISIWPGLTNMIRIESLNLIAHFKHRAINNTWHLNIWRWSYFEPFSTLCWFLIVFLLSIFDSKSKLSSKSYPPHNQQYVALEDMKMELSWAILHTTRAHSSHNWGQQGPAKAATTKKMWTNWKIAWSEKHWNTSKYNLNRWISHKVHQ